MAKKSRRVRLSATQRYMPQPGAPAAGQPGAPVARPMSAARSGQTIPRLGRNPEDYTYIRADLQRIGILAGSILVILLALRILVFR